MADGKRWIMTTAPASFDIPPYATDLGAAYTYDNAPLRKVTVPHYLVQIEAQMESYNSERTDDGDPVYVSILDTHFADAMVSDPDFATLVKPIVGDTTTTNNEDTDMPARKARTTTPRTTTTSKTPVATPATPAKPVVVKELTHLEKAMALQAQRNAEANAKKAEATRKIAEGKAAAQAAQPTKPVVVTPGKPLIMTPNTPPDTTPVSDEQAEKRAQALARLVKVEAEVKEITAFLTQQKLASRVAELETQAVVFRDSLTLAVGDISTNKEVCTAISALVQSQQSIIDNLLGALDSMTTRMADIENAVASFLVGGAPETAVTPARPRDIFDVLGYAHETMIETPVVAPMWGSELDMVTTAPVATAPHVRVTAPARNGKAPETVRTIPARGTGALATFTRAQAIDARNRYMAGETQKAIALTLGLPADKDGSKIVWHLINKLNNGGFDK